MATDPPARLFAKVHGGAQLHVRTCASLFRILETAGRIALKFGMLLEAHWLSVLQKLMLGTVRAHVQLYPEGTAARAFYTGWEILH